MYIYDDYARINMIGKDGSGKTSFLSSMYYRIGYDHGKYTVMAPIDEDETLARMYWDLNAFRKWPASSPESYEYHFKLYRSLNELYKFTYIDRRQEDFEQLSWGMNLTTKQKTCKGDWLIFLDGCSFIAEASDRMEYKEKVKKQLELNGDLYFKEELMAYERPSICVVVTKSDLISASAETVQEIVYEALEPLFTSKHSKNVTVLILPVTVGKNLNTKEWLQAQNVDLPFLFFAAEKMGRLFWTEELKWRQKELPDLLEMFPDDLNIYVNGIKRNLKDHYRKFLSEGV